MAASRSKERSPLLADKNLVIQMMLIHALQVEAWAMALPAKGKLKQLMTPLENHAKRITRLLGYEYEDLMELSAEVSESIEDFAKLPEDKQKELSELITKFYESYEKED